MTHAPLCSVPSRAAALLSPLRLLLLLLLGLAPLSLALPACDDEGGQKGGSLAVFIVSTEPNPAAGHAPVEVSFEVDFSRGDDALEDFEVVWDFGDGATVRDQLAPTHTYVRAGEYVATVTVTHRRSGATGSATEPVDILPSAELTASGMQARPAQLVAGQNLQALFSLRNESVAVEFPFSAVVFLTTDATPDADDLDEFAILSRTRLAGMPAAGEPGSVLDFNEELRVPESVPSGEYYVGVLIDADQQIGEVSEANNISLSAERVRISNPTTDGPDLVAVDVSVNPKRTRILSSARVDFAIENRGPATALGFGYAVYLSVDEVFDEDLDTLLLEAQVEGLTRGGRLEVRDVVAPINPAITEPGDYFVFVVMDPRGTLTEIDETNNVTRGQTPILVTDEPILDADIVVTSFTVEPRSTYLGGSFEATIELVNQGSQPTGSFICSVYLSRDQVLRTEEDLVTSSVNIFDLPGDTQQTASAIVSVPAFYAAGDYWAFVFCDASGVVVEFDEDNNIQRFPEQMRIALNAQVDLEVSQVTIDPPSPVASGTAIEVSVQACNHGSTGSSPNTLRVLLSQDNAPDASDRVAFETTMPGIGPGECVPLTFTIDGTCTDWQESYQLLVVADVRNIISETNENNNVAVLPGSLVIEGEYCRCVADMHEPNNFPGVPATLTPGTHTGLSLCAGDADWFKVAVGAKDSLRVTLRHDPSRGELDVVLLDPSRTPLERSGASGDGHETVDTWLVPSAGEYLIQVVAASAGQVNIYDLDIEVIPPQQNVVDLAAVDVRTPSTQPELNTPWDIALALVNLGTEAVTTPVRVTLYLTQDTTIDPEVDVELDQFEVASIAGQQRIESTRSVIIPGDTASGFWRIGAVADTTFAVAESDETNNGSVSPPFVVDTSCFDVLEPNDSPTAAVEIVPQSVDPATEPSFPDLVVCKTNPDFYRIHALNGKQLRITATAGPVAGDFDLVLRNAAGDEVAAARTSAPTETLFLPLVVGDQDLFLEVLQVQSNFNSQRSQYALTVTMVDADPSLVCNALFEPNDSFATATSLIDAAATPEQNATCPETDRDTYRINLSAGTRIVVGLQTTSTKLRATLYDPNRLPVAGQTIFDPTLETIDYTAPFSGTYYVRVNPTAGAPRQIDYRLTLSGVAGVDLVPEELSVAPPTTSAGAQLQYSLAIANPGTQPSGPFTVDILLSEDALITSSDILLASLSGIGPVPAQGSIPLSGKVDLPESLAGGRYHLGVVVDATNAVAELDEFNNDATATVDITAQCLPDAFEFPQDNNASLRATQLAPVAPASATLCPGDVDWWVVEATAGQALRFDATFTHANGDIDLYVYDQSGTRIGEGRSLTDNETVTVTPASAGPIYVEVRGFTGAVSNSYILDYSTP